MNFLFLYPNLVAYLFSIFLESFIANFIADGDYTHLIESGEFKPIPLFPQYLINKDGLVINTTNKRINAHSEMTKGYYQCSIKGKKYLVHRLIAMTFIPNPENKEQVNHIDGDKKNNNIANLEWATSRENADHATALSLRHHRRISREQQSTIVELLRAGVSIKSISIRFSISRNRVSYLRKKYQEKGLIEQPA